MPVAEIYDYLSATPVTPDYNYTLDVTPHRVLPVDGSKNQSVNRGDDNSREVITYSDDSIFIVTLCWDNIVEADAGTILDWWHDTAKANGMARSFKWTNNFEATDPHTYTVAFAGPLTFKYKVPNSHEMSVKLEILGRAP